MDRIPVRESGIGEEILHKDIFIEQSWVVIRTSYSLAMTSVLMVSRHKRIIQSIKRTCRDEHSPNCLPACHTINQSVWSTTLVPMTGFRTQPPPII